MPWWENRYLSVKGHILYIGKTAAPTLARQYGTPLFIYSRAQILANYRKMAEAFAGQFEAELRILYAMKANPHCRILSSLRATGAGIDTVSPGEVQAALEAGFPPEKILYTGTSVSEEDLRQVCAVDGVTLNIDALEQLDLMKKVRDRWFKNKNIRVSVRWNPEIGFGFNPKVITAGKRSAEGTPIKFGIEESQVLAAFRKARRAGFIPVGLHQHLGSSWVKEDLSLARKAVEKMILKAAELRRKGFSLEFLDFGGGFGPRYIEGQRKFPVEAYARHIGRTLRRSGLDPQAIAVEPGKYLVADAGVLLVRVVYLKKSYGNIFACVDGGTFNTLPRPAIYAGADHAVVNGSRVDGWPRARVTVAGHLCETGDVFAKDIRLSIPQRGDVLAILCAGAYARSMASNFNLRPIPREIII
jgi:diaminopimelate decarboxylase